jgi:hypothetical protein
LAGLPNGLYTVVISDDTGVHTAKFVKAGGSRP